MVTMGTQGGIDASAAIVGSWSDVNFISPITPYVGTYDRYNIGNVEQAVLELTREDYIHVGTALPRVADYVVPIKAGMKFTGQLSEYHRAALHALIGDALSTSSQYIYPGTQACNVFFTLQAMRRRACDNFIIEARIFKVHPAGVISIGSSDQAVTTPMDLEGLDDQANSMYQGGGASAPIGFLYVPTEGSSVKETPVTT